MRKLRYFLFFGIVAVLCSCSGKQNETGQKPVKVKVQQVGAVQVNGERGYSGTVTEESGVSLSFPMSGTIERMAVDEGQMVQKGQLVATINATDQAGAQQSAHAVTQQAKQALRQAQDNYNRSKGLYENGVISEAKWVQAQTALEEAKEAVKSSAALETIAKKSSGDTRLTAPFSGYIASKDADVGQNVLPGASVARLVHIDRVKVNIAVPEAEVNQIANGETMMITCEALDASQNKGGMENTGSEAFYGKVVEKGVTADPLSRTYDIKLLVNNPNHKLLPGMICNVYSRFRRGETSVFIPTSVVQLNPDNRMFVWIVKDGKATKRYINFVASTSQGIRVSGGLEPGDQLIVEGHQKVSEGTPCKVIN